MQTLTFPCPLCGLRMGVAPDLGGKPVRCPHCRQVVVAPGPGGSGPTAIPHRPPVAPVPDFLSSPPTEGAESIFSEGDGDDESLFATAGKAPKVILPDAPDPLQPTDAVPLGPDLLAVLANAKTPHTAVEPVTPGKPAADGRADLFGATPAQFGQRPSEVSNPFAKLDTPPAFTAPALTLTPLPLPADAPGETEAGARRPSPLVLALAVYAVLVTVVAAFAVLRGGDRGHPLNAIPDLFGEFKKAAPGRTADLRPLLDQMGWDGRTVPPELRARIGGAVAVGDLTVEPLAVEEARPRQVTVFAGPNPDAAPKAAREVVLALRLRVTNTGRAAFHPTDPAFNRRDVAGVEPPLTGLVLDGVPTRIAGGPLPWPPPPGVQRAYFDGQQGEDAALPPGESRDVTVYAVPGRAIVDRVKSGRKPVQWQVHLRRGTTRFRGEDVPVTCLIAVDFDPGQVKSLPTGV